MPHLMPADLRPDRAAVVVDDDRDSADTLAMVLSAHGLRVWVAYSAADALVLVARHRPHAVVSDLEMPAMDGLSEAQAIRAMHGVPQPCLIALTGQGALERLARDAGFDHFFVKPADPARILTLIRACPVPA